MDIYVTKANDTWDKIAKEVYGSELYASYLMENNQDLIDYFVFPQGIKLKIVALLDKEDEALPEWRQ